MDVRVKLSSGGPEPRQEILTGLPDGSLGAMFHTLLQRHPELATILQQDELDATLLRLFVNDRLVRRPTMHDFLLKDGDTVSLFVDESGAATSS